MLIAIISDIHDNLANLKKVLHYINDHRVDVLFFLGDLTNRDTLRFVGDNFHCPIYWVKGNCDLYEDDELKAYPQITCLGRTGGRVELDGQNFALMHEPELLKNFGGQNIKLAFYGHTHKPWQEIKNGVNFINPGNVSNTRFAPTFATYDTTTKNLSLVALDEFKI